MQKYPRNWIISQNCKQNPQDFQQNFERNFQEHEIKSNPLVETKQKLQIQFFGLNWEKEREIHTSYKHSFKAFKSATNWQIHTTANKNHKIFSTKSNQITSKNKSTRKQMKPTSCKTKPRFFFRERISNLKPQASFCPIQSINDVFIASVGLRIEELQNLTHI